MKGKLILCYIMFVFSACIMKSMKSGSNCPVCKVPFRRRGMCGAFIIRNCSISCAF